MATEKAGIQNTNHFHTGWPYFWVILDHESQPVAAEGCSEQSFFLFKKFFLLSCSSWPFLGSGTVSWCFTCIQGFSEVSFFSQSVSFSFLVPLSPAAGLKLEGSGIAHDRRMQLKPVTCKQKKDWFPFQKELLEFYSLLFIQGCTVSMISAIFGIN